MTGSLSVVLPLRELFPNKPLLIMSAALVEELLKPLRKVDPPLSRVVEDGAWR